MELDPAQRDLRPTPDVLVVVLVAGKYLPPPPSMQLPYDHSTHAVPREDPDLIVWADRRALAWARGGT